MSYSILMVSETMTERGQKIYWCALEDSLIYCRYSDIIVHRLLAVCIGADASYPELTDKYKTQVSAQFEFGEKILCDIWIKNTLYGAVKYFKDVTKFVSHTFLGCLQQFELSP